MVKFPELTSVLPFIVFIGHSSKNKQYAYNFFLCLKKIENFLPYMAEYYTIPGENYKERIMHQLEQSTFVIFLLTKEGVKSQWVNQEIGYALSLIHISEPTRRTPISY